MQKSDLLVLIAEDNSVSRVITQKSVEKLGYKTVIADTGTKAWELYQKREPNIIISDCMMPEMEGTELCRKVRAQPFAAYTYFMLLTMLVEKKDFVLGVQAGADDYLLKPLDRDQLELRLLSAARICLAQRRLIDQKAELERMNHELAQRVGLRPGMRP